VNIVCVGDCGVDCYRQSGECRPGGITLNFAIEARRCFADDDQVTVIAPLGDDAAADVVRRRLRDCGVATCFPVLRGATPVQYIELDTAGERHFVRYDEGVLRDFRVDGSPASRIREADLLVTPVFEQNRAMFESVMAVTPRGLTAVDFSDFAAHRDLGMVRRHADRIDVGFFGLQADQAELIDALREIARASKMLAVATLGADGSRAFRDDEEFACPASPVPKVVDTTGAGDAFAAGFLSQYCRSRDVDASLAHGAARAAEAVQRLGGN
jgi:sugar/nucleoside kinase (ribokinase family)